MNRRSFIGTGAVSLLTPAFAAGSLPGKALTITRTIGKLGRQHGPAPVESATWYTAESLGDGFECRFEPGTLSRVEYLAADLLLEGNHLLIFNLELQEGEKGRTFRFHFGGLNQVSFRMRMPLGLTDQNTWRIEREGAFLKPIAGGQRVNAELVDRIRLVILRKAPGQVRWCMTPVHASAGPVEKLTTLVLPKGKLVDELGQSRLHDWPGKTRAVEQLKTRVGKQYAAAEKQSWPAAFSRWGGLKEKKLGAASGFFRVHNDGSRWWLVDPDGHAFWSAGVDCVRVDTEANVDGLGSALTWWPNPRGPAPKRVNYLAENMIRCFGPDNWRAKWATVALAELKRLRFNTVGNWSEWQFARDAKIPYVRPMSFGPKRSSLIYRDFPDVYHAGFESDAEAYAEDLKETASDPALIGYFLMNEPKWGFSSELPAAGMLFNSDANPTRSELVRFLKRRYADEAALAASWKTPVNFGQIAAARWKTPLPPEAMPDLRAFSSMMVERYFTVLSRACRKADPNHLNLGMRWASVPPDWAAAGMKSFDVYSLNCYQEKLPREASKKIADLLGMPVMVGEWHFGALDAGLPATGIGHVKTQADRGRAYRVYFEDAVANPYCVGAHWFTLYDQSALGRNDGENYNIGFLDICHRPYPEIGAAAIASHERLYEVARGREAPFADAPEYLPKLF